MTSSPTGIACNTGSSDKCSYGFASDGTVTLTATPSTEAASYSAFAGWSGTDADKCLTGTAPTVCNLTLDGMAKNVTATFQSSKCTIGNAGPAGGIIFYCDGTTGHGMEAAPVDQAPSIWGCWDGIANSLSNFTIVGSTSKAIGTGAANTAAIIAACPGQSAAATATAYTLNGYADWYLPSSGELMLLFNNQGVVGGFAIPASGLPSLYWSSTEFSRDLAWVQDFHLNVPFQGQSRKNGLLPPRRVRAVRAF